MVDGETYGCVKSFCYLGDTLDGDGGADLAARSRNGWMWLREMFPFLTYRPPPLEMKGRVYACCVRSSMIYGGETGPLLVDVGYSEELRKLVGVEPITTVIRSGRLRWLKAEDQGHGSKVLKRIWQNLRSTEKMSMTRRNGERTL